MKKILTILSAMLLTATWALAQCQPGLFQETFETANAAWTIAPGYSATFNDPNVFSGQKALRLQGGAGNNNPGYSINFPAQTNTTFKFSTYIQGAGTTNNLILLDNGTEKVNFYYAGAGAAVFINGTMFNAININAWNTFEFTINYATNQLTIAINGVQQSTVVNLLNTASSSSSISGIALHNYTAGIALWDNLIFGEENLTFDATIQQPLCSNDLGSIQSNIITGVGPYMYSWSNGSIQSNISNLTPGNYLLDILDLGTGCSTNQSYTITAPAPLSNTINLSNCNSVSYQGITYNQSGTHSVVLTSAQGCDSTITLNVTIHGSQETIDTINSCADYSWINGTTYTESNNTATMLFTSSNGCDSLVRLHLTVTKITSGVTVSNGTISANYTNGTYQWLECNGAVKTPIAGETGISYSPSVSGSYAVEINHNGCTRTSLCFNVTAADQGGGNTSLEWIDENIFQVYPNPTNGIITITSTLGNDEYSIQILNSVGQKIHINTEHTNNNTQIDLSNYKSGIYFIEVSTAQKKTVLKKVIKL